MERSVATARRRPTPRVAGPGSRARGPPRTSKTYHAGGWRRAASSLRGGLASALRAVSQEKGGSMTESEVSHQVDVDLGDRSYPIYIGENLLDRGDLLRKHIPGKQVLIVTNETIAPIYLERVTRVIREADPALQVESVVLPDGEQHKNTEVLMKVWDRAMELRFNRKATFVALGGGVIGDMTGFAASAFQRGVHFIQVPTTVMAMVDSSVGGKTGVNHPLGKNMIGAFYQPNCVLIDTLALRSLPNRETASGVSEIIKYGLIWDADLFKWLEENIDSLVDSGKPEFGEAIASAVERSCLIKAAVVAQDEREGGIRAFLNLGHTFGHAVETFSGYGTYLHGEAVGVGLAMAADLSARLGWITEDIRDRAIALVQRCDLPTRPPKDMTPDDFIQLMAVDKKNVDGSLRLVLLRGELGTCVVTSEFENAKLMDTLNEYCEALG
ncbi:3-dehydroquinate synthase [Chloropicon roscoffensis]|uniref:3-dehydroquinate synthase n=2 Tax=Chloropicon roscoffensis TaxID=1461544 RepID=A0AAX4PLB3_9CHLO